MQSLTGMKNFIENECIDMVNTAMEDGRQLEYNVYLHQIFIPGSDFAQLEALDR